MSLKKDTIIDSQGFIALKARVKNEMLRRNGNGSLTTYAGTAYDYSVAPTIGGVVKEEHYDKIRDLMANINPTKVGLGAKKVDDLIGAMDILEANMTVFESQPRGARSGNDCASLCSGVCISQCTTSCQGCDGCDGCDGCSGCGSACSDCTGCSGCSGCGSACSDCTGCSGCSGCGDACTWNCQALCGGCSDCSGSLHHF